MTIKVNLFVFLFATLFFVTNKIEIYILVMAFALLHELGHIICGVFLGLKVESLKIIPLGFCVEFKNNITDYNKKILESNLCILKKILISASGPIVNIVIIVLSQILKLNENITYANLIILIINLIPIYPLDGGRILKNTLKLFIGNKKAWILTNDISNYFAIIISFISSILIFYYKNISILFALFFIWVLIFNENKRYNTYIKIFKVVNDNKSRE